MDNIKINYFSAAWCGPCKTFKPVIKKLKKAGYPINIIDIDEEPVIAESYRIMSVPTIKIVNEDKVVETMVGVQDLNTLLTKFNLHYPKIVNDLSELSDKDDEK